MKISRIGFGVIMASTPDELAKAKRYRDTHTTELREKDRVRNGQRKDYHQAYYASKGKRVSRFVGVDGEGRNLANGYHAYFMLRAGDRMLACRDGERRLRTRDILHFLSELPSNDTYASFFFDYDVTKILEDVPWRKLERLMDRESRKNKRGGFWPVRWDGFEFDYMPHKEFKVRENKGPWVVINDTGSFFQSKFTEVLELWDMGTDEEKEKIAEGKALRANFAEVTDEYIDEYNALECKLLAELMEKFRAVCEEVGYVPRKWQGPGVVAEAVLEKHGIPKTVDLPIFDDVSAHSVASFGRYAYYGGWFETSLVGRTPAPCVQYDKNSAYPHALQHVPCLVHGAWSRETGRRTLRASERSLCFGAFRPKPGKRMAFGGFPVRDKGGSIRRPLSGKGWYWSMEIASAIHQDFTIYDSWVYERKCDCQPFAFLKDIYAARKKLGKAAKGLVLKLIMNSIYGKLVQSVGNPQYSNPIWGSFITAWVRSEMMDAIHSLPNCKHPDDKVPCGWDVYMVATDAIFTKGYPDSDIGLECGENLGQWDKVVHPNGLFLIQPGMYFDPTGEDKKTVYKTRGVPKTVIMEHRQEFLDAYEKMVSTHSVKEGIVHLPFNLFVGIRQALHRHNMKQAGQFVPYVDPETGIPGRKTSFEWSTKRRPQPIENPLAGFGKFTAAMGFRTLPYLGTVDERIDDRPIQTIPYSRDIGGLIRREMARLDFDDQPDWVKTT